MANVLFFVLNLLGFFGCTHIFTVHLVYSRVLRVMRAFTIGYPLGCRGSACVEVMTTNVLKTEPVTEPEKLSVHGSLVGPVVKPWLNR